MVKEDLRLKRVQTVDLKTIKIITDVRGYIMQIKGQLFRKI